MSLSGTYLSHYYVIAPLAEGGMSNVLLGYDTRRPRFVALKVLQDVYRRNKGASGRLQREAEIYQALDHPSIVRLYETGELEDGSLFLAQEFLRGFPLEEELERKGGLLPLPEAMTLLEDMAGGLHAAHRAGIIHRDVKPQNVIVGADGRATLFDFGIAFAQDDLVQTEAGTIMGTLGYAAPEQRMGFKVDHRADVWSLGAVFFEMVTGARAVPDGTYEQVIRARTEDLPRPSAIRPSVPEVMDELARRLLADDPEDRYQDLRDLLVEIGKLRLDLPEDLRADVFGATDVRLLEQALTAARLGKLEEAQELVERLGGVPPKGVEARYYQVLARIQEGEGYPRLAVKSMEKGLFFDPDNLDAIVDTAMLLLRLGQPEEAKSLLEVTPSPARFDLKVLGLIEVCDVVPAFVPAEETPDTGSGVFDSLKSFLKRR